MKIKALFLVFLFFFSNSCTKIPEVSMTDHKGEGYFCGILYPQRGMFLPMEFALTMKHPSRFADSFCIVAFACRVKVKDRFLSKQKRKLLDDYDYFFVVVKGQVIYKERKNKNSYFSLEIMNVDTWLEIDKFVYMKVVDEDFVKCLLRKEMTFEEYEFYRKHPKEIFKLCPCKPFRKIEKSKHYVYL